ncbi:MULTISPECIES: hypothetical protein [Streptosporangium]|uniref:Mce-associated membrane protein n=1 Tax=Streptosporangium brasiliense TaxID=47480 RepID=A0ABT9QZM6_9ACTN|nr:hypothetical protein [Streptosporangium brasiliense]MDP9861994.1 Mce-associated membrane protein [Streptosporangium brasiliense]
MSPVPQQPEELPQETGSGRGEVPEDGGEPTQPDPAAVPATGAAPDRATPDKAVPDNAAPDKAAPDKAAPDGAAPDRAAPDQAASDKAAPDQVTPEGAAPEEAAGNGERGRLAGAGRWRGRLVGAVAAMAFAATAATAVLQWMAADRLAEEKADRSAVSARAGEFAVALQTYDYSDLQSYRDQVFAISGEDFEKTYDEAFSPLEGVITSMKANSSASVRGVYVAEVAEGRAKAITVVDSQVTSTAGTRRMLGTYMELGLIKTGGEWKVNDATVMGAADELVTDPNGKAVDAAPTPAPSPSTGKKDG